MKIYEWKNDDGKLVAFEVNKSAIGRMGALRIVRSIPGVIIKRYPSNRFLSWGEPDDFCEFELEGQTYFVDEPFGDNSRFLIRPKSISNNNHIDKIRNAFENYKHTLSSILRRVFEN